MISEIELNERNIRRLWHICMYRLKKNKIKILKRTLALIIETIMYVFILLETFGLSEASAPLGFFLATLLIIFSYICFVLTNHFLVKFLLAQSILIVIELYLAITIIAYYCNYLNLLNPII